MRTPIITSFHVNPLRGHFLVSYTIHIVRLRFHRPSMYIFIRATISSYAACILKNSSPSTPGQIFIYLFQLDALMIAIHTDHWVSVNTESFDGFICLMIIVCHMAGFAAIQPVVAATSESFA